MGEVGAQMNDKCHCGKALKATKACSAIDGACMSSHLASEADFCSGLVLAHCSCLQQRLACPAMHLDDGASTLSA